MQKICYSSKSNETQFMVIHELHVTQAGTGQATHFRAFWECPIIVEVWNNVKNKN